MLLEKFGVLGGECVEALLIVGLVLRDSGVGGDQFFNCVANCGGLVADSVGFEPKLRCTQVNGTHPLGHGHCGKAVWANWNGRAGVGSSLQGCGRTIEEFTTPSVLYL